MRTSDLEYARGALRILHISLEQVESGREEFYRVAALQLRLLLCDTTRRHGKVTDISLARRLWPDLYLPPVKGSTGPASKELPLDVWLAQSLPGGISLRSLIRLVCEQDGGAHVDPHPGAGLPEGFDPSFFIMRAAQVAMTCLEKRLVQR